jgi:hypothetical protein
MAITPAVLHNGLGRYQDALAAAQQTGEDPLEQVFSTWAAAELIEAASRSGVPGHAVGALQRLSGSARASGSDWALGVEACARALLSEGETAERLYREGIDRLARTRVRVRSPALASSTGSGCGGRTGGSMPASSCAPRTRCSPPWVLTGSPNELRASCAPPASEYVNARPVCPPSSQPGRSRSPGWPVMACPTLRSRPAYS